jgi:hypothetical protein
MRCGPARAPECEILPCNTQRLTSRGCGETQTCHEAFAGRHCPGFAERPAARPAQPNILHCRNGGRTARRRQWPLHPWGRNGDKENLRREKMGCKEKTDRVHHRVHRRELLAERLVGHCCGCVGRGLRLCALLALRNPHLGPKDLGQDTILVPRLSLALSLIVRTDGGAGKPTHPAGHLRRKDSVLLDALSSKHHVLHLVHHLLFVDFSNLPVPVL